MAKEKKQVDGADTKKKGYRIVNVDTIKSYTDEMIKLYQAIDGLENELDSENIKEERKAKISEEIKELKFKGVKLSVKFEEEIGLFDEGKKHTVKVGLRALFKIKSPEIYRNLAKHGKIFCHASPECRKW